jgi:hypothetical protein
MCHIDYIYLYLNIADNQRLINHIQHTNWPRKDIPPYICRRLWHFDKSHSYLDRQNTWIKYLRSKWVHKKNIYLDWKSN